MTVATIKSRNGASAEITVTAETVTPEIAGDWLSANTQNRRLRDHRVKRLAHAIRTGEWQPFNGETIKFSRTGRLIDGQHRLAAAVMANLPIQTLVARNIDEEAFRTIDTGARRSGADTLYLIGEQNETQLAQALHALYRFTRFNRFLYGEGVTTAEILDMLDQHPDIRDSLPIGIAIHRKLPGIPCSAATVLHYIFSAINRDDATRFFAALRDGTNLGGSDPVYLLRERYAQAREFSGNGFRYQDEAGAYVIKAWNLFRKGKTATRLIFFPTKETYPTPE